MFSLSNGFAERTHGDFRVDDMPRQAAQRLTPAGAGVDATPEAADATPTKRLSLQMSASLHREAKLAALEDDETLNSMVVGLLRNYLRDRRASLQTRHQRRA